MIKSYKRGQVALIVLLIMVVVLTVGLTLISHSITDVSISKDEEESMRVFSAAEAGIEVALQDIGAAPSSIDVGGITANIAVTPVGGGESIVKDLVEGEYMSVDLDNMAANTILSITWTGDAALEMVVFHDNYTYTRLAYSRAGLLCATGFTVVPINAAPPLTVTLADDLLRIRALCSNTTVTITVSSGGLPTQVYQINSKASSGGEKESKVSVIQVSRTNPVLPPIFDYVLFSQGNISQ